MSRLDSDWLLELEEKVPRFLESLRRDALPGRYLPCLKGATEVGREMGLGWSCFALKTLFMLKKWERLPLVERQEWVEFIQGYQRADGIFVDPPELAFLQKPPAMRARLLSVVGRAPWKPDPHSILLAETKQAIATLAEVGVGPSRTFRNFPLTPKTVKAWLEAQDWTRPWGAGGQSAGLVVFILTQGPMFIPQDILEDLISVCRDFFAGLADPATGAYFRGSAPAHGEMVNGAMKVLMALQWLNVPVHYPEKLISTTISKIPSAQGCHLVDAIYVLQQCLAGRPASERVLKFSLQVLEMIKAHAGVDGGFAFNVRKAQTNYYGVEVSKGHDESDVQGTCLLVWACAMIWKLVEPEAARWNVIKP